MDQKVVHDVLQNVLEAVYRRVATSPDPYPIRFTSKNDPNYKFGGENTWGQLTLNLLGTFQPKLGNEKVAKYAIPQAMYVVESEYRPLAIFGNRKSFVSYISDFANYQALIDNQSHGSHAKTPSWDPSRRSKYLGGLKILHNWKILLPQNFYDFKTNTEVTSPPWQEVVILFYPTPNNPQMLRLLFFSQSSALYAPEQPSYQLLTNEDIRVLLLTNPKDPLLTLWNSKPALKMNSHLVAMDPMATAYAPDPECHLIVDLRSKLWHQYSNITVFRPDSPDYQDREPGMLISYVASVQVRSSSSTMQSLQKNSLRRNRTEGELKEYRRAWLQSTAK